mmetsp:Transcript_11850/g.24471  ORF Transcript_11850/g.24471 Transcript_11850/m.24471 type:complete len:202 (+) Transcript_11850:811-1416(+)
MDGQPRLCLWGQAHAGERCALAGLYQFADCHGICPSFLHCPPKTFAHGGDWTQHCPGVGIIPRRSDTLARTAHLLVERHPGQLDHYLFVDFRPDGSGNHSSRLEPRQGTGAGGGATGWSSWVSILQHVQYFSAAAVQALQLVQCLCFQIRSPLSMGRKLHRRTKPSVFLCLFNRHFGHYDYDYGVRHASRPGSLSNRVGRG